MKPKATSGPHTGAAGAAGTAVTGGGGWAAGTACGGGGTTAGLGWGAVELEAEMGRKIKNAIRISIASCKMVISSVSAI